MPTVSQQGYKTPIFLQEHRAFVRPDSANTSIRRGLTPHYTPFCSDFTRREKIATLEPSALFTSLFCPPDLCQLNRFSALICKQTKNWGKMPQAWSWIIKNLTIQPFSVILVSETVRWMTWHTGFTDYFVILYVLVLNVTRLIWNLKLSLFVALFIFHA